MPYNTVAKHQLVLTDWNEERVLEWRQEREREVQEQRQQAAAEDTASLRARLGNECLTQLLSRGDTGTNQAWPACVLG